MTQYAKQSAEYVIPEIQSVTAHHLHSTVSNLPCLTISGTFLTSDMLRSVL